MHYKLNIAVPLRVGREYLYLRKLHAKSVDQFICWRPYFKINIEFNVDRRFKVKSMGLHAAKNIAIGVVRPIRLR